MSLGLKNADMHTLTLLSAPFEIGVATLRTTLSRMIHRGLIIVDKDKKMAKYNLSKKSRIIQANVKVSFRKPDWRSWAGDYSGVVFSFPDTNNPQRYRLRKKLESFRYAQFNPGFWIRPGVEPDNFIYEFSGEGFYRKLSFIPDKKITADEAYHMWSLEDVKKDISLALYKLDQYSELLKEASSESAFKLGLIGGDIAVKALSRDPLLPPILMPENWMGDLLREKLYLFNKASKKISINYINDVLGKYKYE